MSDHGSVRDRLRAHREEVRAKDHLDLLVPGYDDDLMVRYKLLPDKVGEQLSKRIEAAVKKGDQKRIEELSADVLVKSCDAILVREGEEYEVLVDDQDAPIRFDARLAEFLGFEAEDELATSILVETFSPKGEDGIRRNPDAALRHTEALGAWRQGRDHEINQDLLGE